MIYYIVILDIMTGKFSPCDSLEDHEKVGVLLSGCVFLEALEAAERCLDLAVIKDMPVEKQVSSRIVFWQTTLPETNSKST